LQFLDDDDQIETTIGLTEFALKVMTLGVCLMKMWTSHDEELEEVSEQLRRSLFKNLIRSLPVQNH
jgi:hypothetical protein